MTPRKKNTIFLIVIVCFFALFYILRGDYGISVNLRDNVFAVDGPEGFYFSADFARIKSFKCLENLEVGNCVDGGEKYGYQFGTWVNDKFGQYQLCVKGNNRACIAVETNDSIILVFNLENEETTKEFHQAFKQFLLDEGYSVYC